MQVLHETDGGDVGLPPERQQVILRAFGGYAIVARMLLGIVLRIRILLVAPLKPEAPFVWLSAGLMQGVTVSSVLCILFILLSWKVSTSAARVLLAIAFFANGLLYILAAEAIAYFGHGLHRESLDLALHPRLVQGSLEGGAGARMAILLVLYAALLYASDRLARFTRRTRITIPRLLILTLPGLLSVAASPYLDSAETTASPVVQILKMLGERRRLEQLQGTIEIPETAMGATEVRALVPPLHHSFVDDRFPLAYLPPPRSRGAARLPSNVTPNIVIILMESFRSAEVGAYGGPLSNLTPNFDALAKNGFLIDDAYSVGGYTPEGELGAWYGLLASPYEIVVRNRPNAALSGLPELLKARGYHLLWSHPGDQTFYLSSRFYERHGFFAADGSSYKRSEPHTNWGYSDKALARRTASLLDRFAEPFAAMELTISNHHPFELPSDADAFELPLSEADAARARTDKLVGQRTIPMMRTIHYSDEALGLFFRIARTRPWFAHTIFVIVGDHGTPTKPLHDIRSVHELMQLRHHVAMLFYSPLLAGGVRIAGPASQVDIVPTLAGLLNIPGPRSGVGIDLLDPADRAQERSVISWNPEARTVTVTTRTFAYHGVVSNLGNAPAEFSSEILIDTTSDPVGLVNLSAARPAETERLRHLAQTYVEVYPSLIANGRTGLPPSKPTVPLAANVAIPTARPSTPIALH